ncbi:hypothetical protein [Candidatus Amarobacter glycogenicus]|uniref:hypothetical protein n=1 Tax=Candidatus Amarobacter glycogenicus TaxID=3140699 RepID=UPI0031CC78B4
MADMVDDRPFPWGRDVPRLDLAEAFEDGHRARFDFAELRFKVGKWRPRLFAKASRKRTIKDREPVALGVEEVSGEAEGAMFGGAREAHCEPFEAGARFLDATFGLEDHHRAAPFRGTRRTDERDHAAVGITEEEAGGLVSHADDRR